MKLIYKLTFLLTLTAFLGFSAVDASAQGSEKTTITNQEKTITVYPIPASSVANIRLSPALKNEVEKIEIISLIGRKLSEQYIINKNTMDITFTDISEMPQGIYMVVARDKYGKIIQSAKMVVNR
jgi:hypothetical protein